MSRFDELIEESKGESTKESRFGSLVKEAVTAHPPKPKVKYRGMLPPEYEIPPTVTTSTVGAPSREPPGPTNREKILAELKEETPEDYSLKQIQKERDEFFATLPEELIKSNALANAPNTKAAIATVLDLVPLSPEQLAGYWAVGKGFKYGAKGIKYGALGAKKVGEKVAPEVTAKIISSLKGIEKAGKAELNAENYKILKGHLDDFLFKGGVRRKHLEFKYRKAVDPKAEAKYRILVEKQEKEGLPDKPLLQMLYEEGVPKENLEILADLVPIKQKITTKQFIERYKVRWAEHPRLKEGIEYWKGLMEPTPEGIIRAKKAGTIKYAEEATKVPESITRLGIKEPLPKPRPRAQNLKPTDELEKQLIKDGADKEVFEFFESKVPTEKDKFIKYTLHHMKEDIRGAQAGGRIWDESGKGVTGGYGSTYPKWWPEAKTSRKGFFQAMEKEKGVVYERVKAIAERHIEEGLAPSELFSGPPITKMIGKLLKKTPPHPHETMAKNAMKEALAEKSKMNEVYGLSPLKGFYREMIKWPRETFIHARETLSKSVPGGHLSYLGQKLELALEKEKSAARKMVWQAFKGIKKSDRHEFRLLMESDIAAQPGKIATIANPRIREAMPKWLEVNKKVLEISKAMGQDVSKWGNKITNYFPRMWRGEWQVFKTTGKGKTETLAFVKGQGNATKKAKELMDLHPDFADSIHIMPRVMRKDFSTTELSRPGFFRAVNQFSKAFDMTKDDIINEGVLKGVISIKRKKVFVPSFSKRKGKLEGYEEDPVFVYQSLFNRILRKKYIEPFSKEAQALIQKMPTSQKQFAQEYVDKLAGKYSEYPNMQKIMKHASPFMTKLKLGWRPVTAFVNHLQKFQQTLPEVGGVRLAKSYAKKFTKEGRAHRNDIIERTNVLGGEAKYYGGEWQRWGSERWTKDLSMRMFRRAEESNRKESIVALVDDAMERFDFKAVVKEQLKEGVPKNLVFKSQKEMADAYGGVALMGTQGHYGMADFPRLMRGPWGQTLMKFKPFTINFINQMVKVSTGKPLAGTEVFWNSIGGMPKSYAIARAARWWGSNIMVGGIRSLPIPALAGTMAFLAREYPKNPLVSGILAPLGFDISGKAGVHDPWQFYNWYDIFGPYAGTIGRIVKVARSGNLERLWAEWPAGRGVYEALRSEDQYSIYNKEMIRRGINWKERMAMAAGFTPMKTSLYRLLNEQGHMFQDEQKLIRQKYDPKFIELIEKKDRAIQRNDKREYERIDKEIDGMVEKVIDEGGWYSPEILQNLADRRKMERPERMLKRGLPFIPKPKREEFAEMVEKVRQFQQKPQTQITQ